MDVPSPLSFLIPMNCSNNNRFVVGSGDSAYVIIWNGFSKFARKLRKLFSVDLSESSANSFDVAAADPNCGIYFGSLSSKLCGAPATQGFYYYTKKYGVRNLFDTEITTGMEFDGKTQTLYVLDGCTQIISAWKWKNGHLCIFKLYSSRILLNFQLKNHCFKRSEFCFLIAR